MTNIYENRQEEMQIIIPIYYENYTQIKTVLLRNFGEIDYLCNKLFEVVQNIVVHSYLTVTALSIQLHAHSDFQ